MRNKDVRQTRLTAEWVAQRPASHTEGELIAASPSSHWALTLSTLTVKESFGKGTLLPC
jgi:hypothetical protein